MKKAIFGAGCFWCVETMYQQLRGVSQVVSGYAGGEKHNPTYKEVCSGNTGHAEVIEITYNPEIISYKDLVNIFWHIHNPTTLNRQGNDVGTQYRSAIFYQTEEEKTIAEQSKAEIDATDLWADPIVTEITPLSNYFPAEDYHQNYFNEKGHENSYCSMVVAPKVAKFQKKYVDWIE